MFFFGKEVYTGFSMSEFSAAREALIGASIDYKYRLRSQSGGFTGRSRGRMGALGIRSDYDTQYYLLVKKDDYDEAVHVVHQALDEVRRR